ncbi:SDR family NAD(P)-dependent oxidoreductase [Paraburkholderia phenoliruptrix]|uniref:Short-chain dehydrogenase/reductase SDR n=2 Tax=Paraburkholderia phenoliruptrix TaxID=252970 RepID=K0E0Z7_9BURK|nr:glucose 1-dehydrogenase [Paraburkholderia phenoliruptrix]AFT90462.1 short-chain dehydrogenase/reductase SDR [Paraburkholderia phenoliruptrix BR3459a]CAB4051872.1 Glucose 1-dehydrogenase 2 [Paraburkholderia phenoliruptrix]
MVQEIIVSTVGNYGKLSGLVAVVSGGSRGIGRAICLELAREGASVVVLANQDLHGAATVVREIEELGAQGLALRTDITLQNATDDVISTAVERFGKIDILVNNAGGGGIGKPLELLTGEEWDKPFLINTKGTFLMSAAAVRHMKTRKRGVIINMAGASAHRSFPRRGAFGPSKAAILNFTQQASLEWAPYGVRVNAVSPGPIREPETGWQEREPGLAREVAMLPLRRAGTSHEIARAVVYLASDDAAYITGHSLVIDGGGVNTWYLSQTLREAQS